MINGKFKIILVALICLGIIFSASCRKDSSGGVIRLIETLKSEHVMETPFDSVMDSLNRVRETVGERWTVIPGLSGDNHQVWGFSTGFPVLEGSPLVPEINGTFLKRDGEDLKGWEVYDDDGRISLHSFKGYQGNLDGIDLGNPDPFVLKRLLPKGNVLLDVNIEGNTPKEKGAAIEVLLDGKLFHTRELSQRKWYRVEFQNTETGERELRIRLNRKFPDVKIVLRQVRLETPSDIILLSVPRNGTAGYPEGEFVLTYLTDSAVEEQERGPVSSESLFFYYLCGRFLNRDQSIGENPWGIKKKIRVGGHTVDALGAPPKSIYRIPVTVPVHGTLTLGYGIFQEKKRPGTERIINFQVKTIYKGKTRTVWKKRLRSTSLEWFIPAEIDLSPYGEKKIDLELVTEDVQLKEGAVRNREIYPFWMAPVISGARREDEPNVILISLDTVRPDHLKSYGYRRDTSPAVDALADDGVLFENVYSTTSWTLPAHVSLMTGLNGPSHGVYLPYQKMADDQMTLADRIKSRFSANVAFTGGGFLSSTFGFARGFDHYYEIRFGIEKDFRTHEAEKLGRKTTEWLRRNGGRRFFMFIHTYQPHDPYANGSNEGKAFLSPSSQWDRVLMYDVFGDSGRLGSPLTPAQRANVVDLYDGELLHTDTYLMAPLVKALKNLKLYDNTMIIVASDHGEEFYDHQGWLHDHSLYEEAIRIPLIIKFPHGKYKSRRVRDTVRITDIAPTVTGFLGVRGSDIKTDGASLLPVVTGKEKGDRDIFTDLAFRQTDTPYPHIITFSRDHFKLILNREIQSPYTKKVSRLMDEQQVELYHLLKDPGETYNMVSSSKYRDRVKEMLRLIQSHYHDMDIRSRTGEKADMDRNLMDRLRSLGYLE